MLTGACGDRVPVGRGRARSEGGVYARRRQGKRGGRTGGRQEGTERRDGESEGEGGEREGRGRGEGQWREGRERREGDLSTGGNFGIAGSLARQTVARAHICCAPALAQSPSRLQCRLRAAPSARDRMVAGPSTSVSPSVSARACAECMGVRRMHACVPSHHRIHTGAGRCAHISAAVHADAWPCKGHITHRTASPSSDGATSGSPSLRT